MSKTGDGDPVALHRATGTCQSTGLVLSSNKQGQLIIDPFHMSNQPRLLDGFYYHIYNRSVEKQTIFFRQKDWLFWYNHLELYKEKYKIVITAYCFLLNHFHFLIKTGENSAKVSKFISDLCNAYAHYFNINHQRTGHLWQSRFKRKLVSDDGYLYNLIHYINLNPIKHGLVKKIGDWPYSSHFDYMALSNFSVSGLIDEKPNGFVYSPDSYLKKHQSQELDYLDTD